MTVLYRGHPAGRLTARVVYTPVVGAKTSASYSGYLKLPRGSYALDFAVVAGVITSFTNPGPSACHKIIRLTSTGTTKPFSSGCSALNSKIFPKQQTYEITTALSLLHATSPLTFFAPEVPFPHTP